MYFIKQAHSHVQQMKIKSSKNLTISSNLESPVSIKIYIMVVLI